MKSNEDQVREAVAELKSVNDGRLAKYSRNLRYYTNTPRIDIQSMRNPQIIGYFNTNEKSEEDTTDTPNINIIKSCTDTLTSKMAQSKARPFFNCINGSFKDIQICKQAQHFFDYFFDEQNVNEKVSLAFKNACVFETGVVYIDDINKEIKNVLPWQVYIRPSEATYNKVTRVYYEQGDYPVTLLPENMKKKLKTKAEYVTYGIYYDTVKHIRAQYVTSEDTMTIDKYNSDIVPFVFLHYSSPIFGTSSVSIVDLLKTIQQEINIIMAKIKDCSQLTSPLTYFVPESSNIKSTEISNRTGNIIQYRVTPDMPSNPITVATQPFIDGQYIQWVDALIQKAYELVGISMLSAQSKKPSGVDSGIGLQTLQDVESERFQTQLDQVIRCYVDIAKTCLKVFPEDEDILPEDNLRSKITWSEIVEEENKMTIQFSAADSLSKDPSIKLQQLQMLAQAGIIPQSRIAQLMNLPDLEKGYSLANNAIDAVLTVIDDCITNDSFNIPEYIPIPMLKEEIVNTQLSLRAANYELNKADIDKLTQLYQMAEQLENDMSDAANDQRTEMTQEGEEAVQEDAMQGQEDAQGAMQDIMNGMNGGEMTNEMPNEMSNEIPNEMPNEEAAPQAMPNAQSPNVDLDMATKDPGVNGW